MLYELVARRRGKDVVEMTDSLPKVKDRLKTLRKSLRKGIKGNRVEFVIRSTDESTKYKKKPHNLNLSGGSGYPRVIGK